MLALLQSPVFSDFFGLAINQIIHNESELTEKAIPVFAKVYDKNQISNYFFEVNVGDEENFSLSAAICAPNKRFVYEIQ